MVLKDPLMGTAHIANESDPMQCLVTQVFVEHRHRITSWPSLHVEADQSLTSQWVKIEAKKEILKISLTSHHIIMVLILILSSNTASGSRAMTWFSPDTVLCTVLPLV